LLILRRFSSSKPHENNDKHGRGVFASGRKWALGAKKGIETALCQRITGTDWKKVLANRWNRKRIAKKAHAFRGHEIRWADGKTKPKAQIQRIRSRDAK